uniref:Uncharacterized protein n=1 Tax=viral metagenome TaxID=1070528 RepID=A0A6C0E4F0_9ZZZZ
MSRIVSSELHIILSITVLPTLVLVSSVSEEDLDLE